MPAHRAERAAVAALLARIGRPAGAIEPVAGTRNRLWRAGDWVVRLARTAHPFADPATEAVNMAAAAALGVAPEVLHADGKTGAFVIRFAPGRPLDTLDGGALMRIGRTLAKLHGGAGFAGALDPAEAAARYAEALGDDDSRALARQGAALWAALAPGRRIAPCHNDPVPANVIDDGTRALLVDWEFSGLNDPAWDLAYHAVEGGLDEARLDRLLEAYGADQAFAARVRASRAMVLLVNGLWCRLEGRGAAAVERIARFRAMVDSDAIRRQSRAAIAGGAR